AKPQAAALGGRAVVDISTGPIIPAPRDRAAMTEVRQQAITGVTPPEVAEARIREAWPSVASFPGIASLGRVLTNPIVLAPAAWLFMSVIYFGKLLPIFARRYTLTNRRVMIRKGWHGTPGGEVALGAIDD